MKRGLLPLAVFCAVSTPHLDRVPDQYHFKGRLRVTDSITVPWLGGIAPDRTFNMGYFDARLAEMHDNPNAVVPEM